MYGGDEGIRWRSIVLDRIWCIWGAYYNIPEAIFYLLKGDYILRDQGLEDLATIYAGVLALLKTPISGLM